MGIDVGSNSIAEIYYGNNAISEVYYGNDLVWSANVPDVNYIFRDIDSNGNLTLATGNLEDASNLKKIGAAGMYCAFHMNTGIIGKVDLSHIKTVGINGLNTAFSYCSGITEVDLSNLDTIEGNYALQDAFYTSGITKVNLSKLRIIKGNNAFNNCFGYTGITELNLPNLEEDSNGLSYVCDHCTQLVSVNLIKLKKANLRCAFRNCSSLNQINLNSLETVATYGLVSAFENTALSNLSFPALKPVTRNDTFQNMLYNVTGCTVHFPSNLQSVIGNYSWVTSGFGGTNTTVLFDLPSTE